jgi:hypothetical protein
MNNDNTAPSATSATPAASKKKQFLTEVTESHKSFVEELAKEFDLRNAKEAFEVIYEVATSNRFIRETNDNGEEITIDRFEMAAKAIENERARVKATERRLSLLERMRAEAEAAGMTLAQYLENGAA